MKRVFLLLVALFLFIPTGMTASDVDILPTMQSRSNVANKVWSGSFQVAWNSFLDKYASDTLRFANGTPPSVRELNMRTFAEKNIPAQCVYKYVNKFKRNSQAVINKNVRKKFNETAQQLDLNTIARNDKVIIYSMLHRDIEFINQFDDLGLQKFGAGESVRYYGINKDSKTNVRAAAEVLFYHSPNDYAAILKTTDDDLIYLYKTNTNKDFAELYREMFKKSERYYGDKNFREVDELKVPVLTFNDQKIYNEIINQRVKGSGLNICAAVEDIKFNMSNKGGELQLTDDTMLPQEVAEELIPNPRLMYFDDTFVIFVKNKFQSQPYFALRVHDIHYFQ